jgi:pyruvate dehydrogenase E2 component (dihydrolipoamide acetyltransferase)
MAEIVRMPKLSDTMTEGVVAKWNKKVGDKVKSGDILAEIETDKATMEFESFLDGVLLHIGVQQGQTAPVDSLLAIFGKEGEDITKLLAERRSAERRKCEEVKEGAGAGAGKAKADRVALLLLQRSAPAPVQSQSAPAAAPAASATNGRVKASPLAKNLAEEKGIDISRVRGSGPDGRVTKADIENSPVVAWRSSCRRWNASPKWP